MKTASRKVCAQNLFVDSDLIFDSPFKVKLFLVTFNAFPLFSLVMWSSKQKSADIQPIACYLPPGFSPGGRL